MNWQTKWERIRHFPFRVFPFFARLECVFLCFSTRSKAFVWFSLIVWSVRSFFSVCVSFVALLSFNARRNWEASVTKQWKKSNRLCTQFGFLIFFCYSQKSLKCWLCRKKISAKGKRMNPICDEKKTQRAKKKWREEKRSIEFKLKKKSPFPLSRCRSPRIGHAIQINISHLRFAFIPLAIVATATRNLRFEYRTIPSTTRLIVYVCVCVTFASISKRVLKLKGKLHIESRARWFSVIGKTTESVNGSKNTRRRRMRRSEIK